VGFRRWAFFVHGHDGSVPAGSLRHRTVFYRKSPQYTIEAKYRIAIGAQIDNVGSFIAENSYLPAFRWSASGITFLKGNRMGIVERLAIVVSMKEAVGR
jgi:hypothetical protein